MCFAGCKGALTARTRASKFLCLCSCMLLALSLHDVMGAPMICLFGVSGTRDPSCYPCA